MSSSFLCIFCQRYLLDSPRQAPCGDRLCGSCYKSLQQREKEKVTCPVCEQEIQLSQCFRDKAVELELANVTVKCSNPDCPWEGQCTHFHRYLLDSLRQAPCRDRLCGSCYKSCKQREKENVTCPVCKQRIPLSNSCIGTGIKDDSTAPSTEGGRSSISGKRKQDEDRFKVKKPRLISLDAARVTPSNQSLLTEKSVDTQLCFNDFREVTNYLLLLDKTQVYHLGIELGLNYTKVRNRMDSLTFCDDVVAAWLRKEDEVEKKAPPTWKNLVTALRSKRVGQNGLANEIAKERCITLFLQPDRSCGCST